MARRQSDRVGAGVHHLMLQATKVLLIIALAVIAVAAVRWAFLRVIASPAVPARTVTIVVVPDESSAQLAQALQAAGLIRFPTLFRVELVLKRPGGRVAPGRYVLHSGMTISQIVDALGHPAPGTPAP